MSPSSSSSGRRPRLASQGAAAHFAPRVGRLAPLAGGPHSLRSCVGLGATRLGRARSLRSRLGKGRGSLRSAVGRLTPFAGRGALAALVRTRDFCRTSESECGPYRASEASAAHRRAQRAGPYRTSEASAAYRGSEVSRGLYRVSEACAAHSLAISSPLSARLKTRAHRTSRCSSSRGRWCFSPDPT